MVTLLHLAFRVKNPARSAALYAELLDGRVFDIDGPLNSIGVKGVAFGQNAEDWLRDQIELWPADKLWSPNGFVDIEPSTVPFGHFAVRSERTYKELEAIAERHGVRLTLEDRGFLPEVPVIYDYDGHFIEFFPMNSIFRA